MHASIADLLSLRDTALVDARIAQHVEKCALCTRELQQLSLARAALRRMPQIDAPAESWSRIQQRAAAPSGRGSPRRWWSAAAAIAAVAVIVVALARREEEQPAFADIETLQPGAGRGEPVAALVERSQELERMLQSLPERPRIERVSTVATIDVLEQRIQWLDFQLSYAPEESLDDVQARRLWRERVELMDSLVKVRYAEAGRTSF
jgi:hypothetical protein